MAHIQRLARKRPTVRFFGTECQIADIAHEAIELRRLADDNAALLAENAGLIAKAEELLQGQTTIALRFAELAEREQALVAAAEAADAARLKAEEEANELRAHIKDLEMDNEILCDRLKIDEQGRRDAEATRAEYRQMARGQL